MAHVRLRKAKFLSNASTSAAAAAEESRPASYSASSTALVRRHFHEQQQEASLHPQMNAAQQQATVSLPPQQVQEQTTQEQKDIEAKLIPLDTSEEGLMLEFLQKRNKEIHKIERDVVDVHASYKVLHTLVRQQGEQIDQISTNSFRSRNKAERGLEELKQAERLLARNPL